MDELALQSAYYFRIQESYWRKYFHSNTQDNVRNSCRLLNHDGDEGTARSLIFLSPGVTSSGEKFK